MMLLHQPPEAPSRMRARQTRQQPSETILLNAHRYAEQRLSNVETMPKAVQMEQREDSVCSGALLLLPLAARASERGD